MIDIFLKSAYIDYCKLNKTRESLTMTKSERQNVIQKAAIKAQSNNPLPTMAQRKATAKAVARAELDTAKRDFTAHLMRGNSGVNLNMKVEFGADVDSSISSVPKQIRLLCQYMTHFGNRATFQQLNDYADKAVGIEFWGRGDIAYEQSVAKIGSHYMDKLLGKVEWSKKLGKQEILRLVKA